MALCHIVMIRTRARARARVVLHSRSVYYSGEYEGDHQVLSQGRTAAVH